MVLKYLKQRVRQYRLRRAAVLDRTPYWTSKVGDWAMWPGAMRPDSVVYSFGVGTNIAWDREVIQRFGTTIHAFDPTPASIAWVNSQSLPAQFIFHPYGISDFDGTLEFYPPRRAGNPHYSQERRGGRFDRRPPVRGQVYRLATIMKMLGHEHLDLVKLDVEGSEFEAIPDILNSGISIDQLLIEIHYQFPSRSFRQAVELIDGLKAHGMQCIHVSERGYEFAFVRRGLRALYSRSKRRAA